MAIRGAIFFTFLYRVPSEPPKNHYFPSLIRAASRLDCQLCKDGNCPGGRGLYWAETAGAQLRYPGLQLWHSWEDIPPFKRETTLCEEIVFSPIKAEVRCDPELSLSDTVVHIAEYGFFCKNHRYKCSLWLGRCQTGFSPFCQWMSWNLHTIAGSIQYSMSTLSTVSFLMHSLLKTPRLLWLYLEGKDIMSEMVCRGVAGAFPNCSQVRCFASLGVMRSQLLAVKLRQQGNQMRMVQSHPSAATTEETQLWRELPEMTSGLHWAGGRFHTGKF